MSAKPSVRGEPAAWVMRGRGPVLPVLLGVLASSCVFDSGDRCGPNQRYFEEGDNCVCDDGWVVAADGDGCVACGEHQVAMGGECVCEDGYTPGGDGSCTQAPEGLGASCEPGGEVSCAGDYDHCATGADGSGYCTLQGCSDDGDCDSGYACEQGSPRYCSRPPTGQGQSCASDDDCADYEASFCESLVTMMCAVEGCKALGGACHGGFTCCDFSSVAPTLDFSLCVPPDQLMDGACPFGATEIGGEP